MNQLVVFVIFVFTLFCCYERIGGGVSCPFGWKVFQNSCYKFPSEKRSWFDSQKQCRLAGADLVKISSKAENDFVFRNKKGINAWLGLHRGSDHKFYWRDGTRPTGYSNWAPGEPNDAGGREDCGHMWIHFHRQWNDYPCHGNINYVCEKQAQLKASGMNVSCGPDHMAIDIPKSRVGNFHREDFTLNNKSCGARENSTHFSLVTSLDECGTVAKETKNKMVYTNRVLERAVPKGSNVTRVRPLEITFSCSYPRHDIISAHGIRPNYRKLKFIERGNGEFSLALDIFPNRKFKRPFKRFPVSVNLRQVLFIQASLKSADKELTINTEQCFATPRRNPNSKPVHTLIANSCPVDKTVTYLPSPSPDVRRFTVEAFKFVGSRPFAFIHCKIVVCNATDVTSVCTKQCHSRSRSKRDTIGNEIHTVTSGPLMYFDDKTQAETMLDNQVKRKGSKLDFDTKADKTKLIRLL